MATVHTPVLLQEVIDGLSIQPGDVVVDGTVGGAGHSEELLKRAKEFGSGQITLICLDADAGALQRARERLAQVNPPVDQAKIFFIESNFRRLVTVLDELGVPKINKLLLDLGLSSDELMQSGRGFSFQKTDEPLLMTFADSAKEPALLTAETILNSWSAETLTTILTGYGEERYAFKIAQAIVEARRVKQFKTVGDLVEVILAATPKSYQHRKIHPATKTFQALRITVNDELGALQEALEAGWQTLASGGRIAIISFHSLEDRIVKRFFQQEKKEGRADLLTKKPTTASRAEAVSNPRSRSAKLRVICKK